METSMVRIKGLVETQLPPSITLPLTQEFRVLTARIRSLRPSMLKYVLQAQLEGHRGLALRQVNWRPIEPLHIGATVGARRGPRC